MKSGLKRIEAIFYRTAAGGEPVRDWLKSLDPIEDRKTDRGRYQDGGVWLADRHAGLPSVRRWPLRGTLELVGRQDRPSALLHRHSGKNGPSPRVHKKDAEDPTDGLGIGTKE